MSHIPSTGFTNRSTLERKIRKEKQIYYLVTEGKTEINYFNHIRSIIVKKNLNVDIRYLNKTFSDQNRTDPTEIYEFILEKINISDTGKISIKKLVEELDHWLRKTHTIIQDFNLYKEFSKKFLNYLKDNGIKENDDISIDNIENETSHYHELFNNAIQKLLLVNLSELNLIDFKKYLKESIQYINTENDKICMIIDRDTRRVINGIVREIKDEEEDLEIINNMCEHKNIKLYISNPCFEFWILLHLDNGLDGVNLEKMEKDEMVACPKLKGEGIGENKDLFRYSYCMLKNKLENYSKGNYYFKGFSEQGSINRAIINSKKYSTTMPNLKNNLGTNLGLLVEELLNSETSN